MTNLLERTLERRPGRWPSPFTANLIAQQRVVGSPLVSPDGRWIAYVQDYNRRADLWVMPARGGGARLVSADSPCASAAPRTPFAGSYGGGFAWTPDSAALIYTSADDGKLRRVPRDGGPVERITEGPGVHLSPSLAPDGSFVAYFVDRGDVDDQLFVAIHELSTATPSTTRLTPAGVAAMDPQVSPDGSRVACSLYPTDDRWAHDAQVAVIDLATRAIRVLTPGTRVLNYLPRWSPDGETLAFVSDRSGFSNVWTISARGGEPRPLAPCDEEVEDLCWAPDGRRVAYTTNSLAEKRIVVADVTTGSLASISTEPGVHSDLVWFPDGGSILGLHQSPRRPPNLIVYDASDRTRTWLTDVAVGGLAEPDLFVEAEHVSWRSTDGLEVYGLLLAPNEIVPHRHPALVQIHGGPTAQSRMEWDPIAQYFVSRGWVVIKPNFRGSRGYGRRFTDLLHGAWSKGDLQDNVTSVDVLRERGLVDERRVVAWGGSGGGLATFACLTMAPERFAAGVALYGVADFLNFPYQADRFARDLIDSELGARADNEDLWRERSPLTHAAQAGGPLLVLHGDIDRRVPLVQSETMVAALRNAGKPVEFHVYEGEGHGWRKCATIQDYIPRMEAFLLRHVLER